VRPSLAGEPPAPLHIVYDELGVRNRRHPVVLLLHGSPGSKSEFGQLAPPLATSVRVIAPDLPGFGRSSRALDDYSFRAHGADMVAFLDALGLDRVHVVGFSMGGGVALSLIDRAPDRVASLTMLSAIGVQELELLGSYRSNHVVHGAQLAALQILTALTPHMGALDTAMLNVPYARNFYDSDQRPLRAILHRFAGPALILHGTGDLLVPYAAALEHHRLLPQSELVAFDDGHFRAFTHGVELAATIATFISRVEAGNATTRATADLRRVDEANRPFDPASIPAPNGLAAVVRWAGLGTAGLSLAAAGFLARRLWSRSKFERMRVPGED
jgi:pimeloyl-ACP methyl ester carboxylesterase